MKCTTAVTLAVAVGDVTVMVLVVVVVVSEMPEIAVVVTIEVDVPVLVTVVETVRKNVWVGETPRLQLQALEIAPAVGVGSALLLPGCLPFALA